MGQIGPTLIAAADYPVAQKPSYGGEFQVYLSTNLALQVATYQLAAANSGVLTPDPVNTLPASGGDLVVALDGPMVDTAPVVLTINGLDQSSSALSGIATFAPPGYAVQRNNVYPIGFSVDVVVAAGKKFKNILSVSAVNTTSANLAKFKFWSMPDPTLFTLVGCSTDKEFTTKARPSRAIACGMNGSAFAKKGRSDPGSLTVNAKYFSFGDGLSRFNGVTCTAMLKLIKEDKIETDRIFLTSYTPTIKPTAGDGEAEAMTPAEGIYEDMIAMMAP